MIKYKYSIGEIVKSKNGCRLEINKQFILPNNNAHTKKGYICRCLSCGNEFEKTECNLVSGRGCPFCANRKVKVGYNDLWTTRPDIAENLVNPNDGYTVVSGANKKLYWQCKICGSTVFKSVSNVSKNGLRCPCCLTGFSIPILVI